MDDKQYESISRSLAELVKAVIEDDITPLEQEIFYDKLMTVKSIMDFRKG